MLENHSQFLIFKKPSLKLKNSSIFLNMRELQWGDQTLSNGMKSTRPPTSLQQVTDLQWVSELVNGWVNERFLHRHAPWYLDNNWRWDYPSPNGGAFSSLTNALFIPLPTPPSSPSPPAIRSLRGHALWYLDGDWWKDHQSPIYLTLSLYAAPSHLCPPFPPTIRSVRGHASWYLDGDWWWDYWSANGVAFSFLRISRLQKNDQRLLPSRGQMGHPAQTSNERRIIWYGKF